MFTTESEKREYALKPMNCPGHILIFKQGIKSYRDLPLRFGEFGQCHRNEPSGGLHGIMRVRGFTQDDGHIFCTEEQIQSEVTNFHALVMKVYKDFGFTEVAVKLALRPEQRIGTEASWDYAENALRQAIQASGAVLEELPGEGAFYGPKIEYHLRDSIGRTWQCGTMQIDPNMPERLGGEYVAADSSRQTPIMLHRAIVGSLERFIGILIEQHAGALPVWLAPTQIGIAAITDAQAEYAREVTTKLQKNGFRVTLDLRNEKINYKIREFAMQKLPYALAVGDREKNTDSVSVRARGQQNAVTMTIDEFVSRMRSDVANKI
jgi:threonyl-tRNA synthetase